MNKVLVFSSGYLPGLNYGGPVVSINNYVELCGEDQEILIITTNHDLKSNKLYPNIQSGWNKVGKAKVKYLNDDEFNYTNITRIIIEVNPSVVYINSFFNARQLIPVLRVTKKRGVNLVLAPRGEFFPNVFKKKKVKKNIYVFILKNFLLSERIRYQATNEEEKLHIISKLNVNSKQVVVVENIPSFPRYAIEKKQKNIGKLKLVYLSRIHPQKNLLFALECLTSVEGEVEFSIYGPKENEEYWEKCETAIKRLPDRIKVYYKGVAEREDIHSIYAMNDAMILPTISENYGHSIVEAMVSKCPVIISDNTPWNDINEYNAGWAISLLEAEKYINALQLLVSLDKEQYNFMLTNVEEYVRNKLKVEELKDKYISLFQQYEI